MSVPMFSIVVAATVRCLTSGLKGNPWSVLDEQAFKAKGKVSSGMTGLDKPRMMDTGRHPVI